MPISLMPKANSNNNIVVPESNQDVINNPDGYKPLEEMSSSEKCENLANKVYARTEINRDEPLYRMSDDCKRLINSINTFASKAFENINKNLAIKTNSAYSPASVFFALSMLSRITSGQDKANLLSALGVTEELLTEWMPTLILACNQLYGGGKERMDNSIWLDDAYNYNESMLQELANGYYADCFEGSFANDCSNMNKCITAYVNECTEGLLKPKYNFDLSTVFTLLTSLFLEDTWFSGARPLDLLETEAFKPDFGGPSTVNYYGFKDLINLPRIGIYETEEYQSAYITTFNKFKLTFIVPKDGYTADDLFTKEILDEVNGAVYPTGKGLATRIYFPEFNASFNGDIKKDLFDSFGINPPSNFASFASRKDGKPYALTTREIIHTTKIEVTKDYIKAAVSSGGAGGAPQDPSNIQELRVNRSFIYTLKDRYDIELFEGVIYNV